MKKLLLLCTVMATFLACSSDDDTAPTVNDVPPVSIDKLVGTWNFFSFTTDGVVEELEPCETEFTFVASEDGAFSSTEYDEFNGECQFAEMSNGTWTNDGNSMYTFLGEEDDEDPESVLFTFEENTFYFEDEDDNDTPDDPSDDFTDRSTFIKQ